jgi:hypothetical protein
MTELSPLERGLLVEGLEDYIGLWQFVRHLTRQEPPLSDDQVRDATVASVRRLVEGGLMTPGHLVGDGGFAPWEEEGAAAVPRIEREWAALGRPPDICWFSNTSAGDDVARRLQ